MSSLTLSEKRKLEKLFGMASGYVLDFSNRTFQETVLDSTGLNIYDEKYGRGSKASVLRLFWSKETDPVVGKLLNDLMDYYREERPLSPERHDCRVIADRLLRNAPVESIDAIAPNAEGKDFENLAKSVRESIDKNEPEAGLDRLHTFAVKYMRVLCQKRGIAIAKEKPLHSLMGEYVKALKNAGQLDSEMAERILKSSISILEAFNDVRNNKSFAHDNPTLNYNESLLIYSNVASCIRFIKALEEPANQKASEEPDLDEADIQG